jgi:hypothetical protein
MVNPIMIAQRVALETRVTKRNSLLRETVRNAAYSETRKKNGHWPADSPAYVPQTASSLLHHWEETI